jgi:dihydrofolate synthase / folylpolyglutamate synthase
MEGIEQLTRQIEVTEHRQLHIIIGMVKDKEVEQILALLPKTAGYYFTKAQVPRAVPESELAKKAANAELKGETYSEVNDALKAALQHAHADDLILICGSVFLVGEVELNF